MSNNFYVGQEVVCVNDDDDFFPIEVLKKGPFADGLGGLEKHHIYTIRKVGVSLATGLAVLHLNEIIRPQLPADREEPGYWVARFRPAVKTDISIFQAMLNPAPTRVNMQNDEWSEKHWKAIAEPTS